MKVTIESDLSHIYVWLPDISAEILGYIPYARLTDGMLEFCHGEWGYTFMHSADAWKAYKAEHPDIVEVMIGVSRKWKRLDFTAKTLDEAERVVAAVVMPLRLF
jgi:hypothetical protein